MSTFSSSFHYFLPVTNKGYYHLLWWTFNGMSLFIFNSRWWQSQLLTRKMAHVRAKLAIASRKIFTRLLYFNDHHSINDWLVHWWSMLMSHERNVWWFKVELDDEKILRATKLRYACRMINQLEKVCNSSQYVCHLFDHLCPLFPHSTLNKPQQLSLWKIWILRFLRNRTPKGRIAIRKNSFAVISVIVSNIE